MKKYLFLCLALFIVSFSTAYAASVEKMKDVPVWGDFDLGPTQFGIEASPGETVKKTLQITNRRGEKQEFVVSVEDFQGSVSDPEATVILQGDKSGRYGAKEWLSAEISKFTIEHGERQFFDVTIKIPENADSGDHYASVLVSAPPQKKETGSSDDQSTNINITSRVGALFFIRVKGDIEEKGLLKSFESDKSWYEKPLVNLRSVFENTGSVRLRPSGSIEMTNMFGVVVDTINVEPYNVLRDSVRAMKYSWEKKGFMIGRYTAKIDLDRGYGGKKDTMSVSFWIIPWKEMLIALIVIVIVIQTFRWIGRKLDIRIKIKK